MSSAETPAFARDYLERFDHTWSDDTSEREIRFVVLDSETTGLDARKDRLITIGAVAVQDDEILLEDSFEAMIKIEHNLQSVTVHGITRDESQTGLDEPAALRQFLDYLRDGVIVGHHIMHDVETLECRVRKALGFRAEKSFAGHDGSHPQPGTGWRLRRAAGNPQLLARFSLQPLRRETA